MSKIIRECEECGETFTTVNKDKSCCNGYQPVRRDKGQRIGKIDPKWLVRGNISRSNRTCSITAGGV